MLRVCFESPFTMTSPPPQYKWAPTLGLRHTLHVCMIKLCQAFSFSATITETKFPQNISILIIATQIAQYYPPHYHLCLAHYASLGPLHPLAV